VGIETISVLSALSALAAITAALYVKFSGPVVTSELVRELQQRVEEIAAEWRTAHIEMNGLTETMTRDYDRAVSARNRASAIERQTRLRDGPAGGEKPRDQWSREDWERFATKSGQMGRVD